MADLRQLVDELTAGPAPILRFGRAPIVLARHSRRHGATVFARRYESGMQRKFRTRCDLVRRRWWLVRLASLGLLDAEGSDCLLVLHRPEVPVPTLTAEAAS